MKYFRQHIGFFGALATFLIIEGVVGFAAYESATTAEQRSLVERTQSVAAALDGGEILQLRGDERDYYNPAYVSVKKKLVRIGRVNSDVTSVYITGYRDGAVFFFADSAEGSDVGEAVPGLTYEEATPLFKSVFLEGRIVFEGPLSDRWGSWVSGLAPILDANTDRVIASVGMDIDSSVYWQRVITRTALPVLSLGVLFLLLIIAYVRYKKNQEMLMLRAKFVSIASHELRSPVSGIVWATQSLLGRTDAALSAATREVVTQIEKTSRKVLGTVSEILELSKLQGAQANKVLMNGVDMRVLIEDIVQSLSLVAKQVGVTVSLAPTMPKKLLLICDKEKTQRVISNILTNALKYSKQGGHVLIGYAHENGRHVVSVKDDGVGIPEGEQGKIFQGNFRASNAEHSLIAGTGIGLHLVKELMEAQGGAVRFISKSSEGTTFFIELKDR